MHTSKWQLPSWLWVGLPLLIFGYLMGGRSVSDTSSWSGIGYAIVAFVVLFTGIFLFAARASELKVNSEKWERKVTLYGGPIKCVLAFVVAHLVLGDHSVRFVAVIVALIAIVPVGDALRGWWINTVLVALVAGTLYFSYTLMLGGLYDFVDHSYIYIGVGGSVVMAVAGFLCRDKTWLTEKLHQRVGVVCAVIALLMTGMAIPAGSFDNDWPRAVMLGLIVSLAHVPAAWLAGEKTFKGLTGHRNGAWSLVLGVCFEVIIPGSALIVLIAVVTSNVLRVVLAFLRGRQLKRRAARQEAAQRRDEESSEEDAPPASAAN